MSLKEIQHLEAIEGLKFSYSRMKNSGWETTDLKQNTCSCAPANTCSRSSHQQSKHSSMWLVFQVDTCCAIIPEEELYLHLTLTRPWVTICLHYILHSKISSFKLKWFVQQAVLLRASQAPLEKQSKNIVTWVDIITSAKILNETSTQPCTALYLKEEKEANIVLNYWEHLPLHSWKDVTAEKNSYSRLMLLKWCIWAQQG